MVRLAPLAVLVLLSSSLAGCTLGGEGGNAGGTLVRIVQLNPSFDAFMREPNDAADVFSALGTTSFEYTHEGSALDPADVTVEYTDDTGRERSATLSEFTSAGTLAEGDRVTIDGVLLTSQLTLRSGGDALAARGAQPQQWLEANGYPLPFTMEPGALLAWDVTGGLDLAFHFDLFQVDESYDDYEYSCTPNPDPLMPPQCGYQETSVTSTMAASNGLLDAGTELEGTLTLEGLGDEANPVLEASVDGDLSLEASANVHVRTVTQGTGAEDDVDADFGFELQLGIAGDGRLRFGFPGGRLGSAGAEGEVSGSGDLTVWDQDHPRSAGYNPGFLDDLSFASPYQEEDLELDDNPVSWIAETVSDLWRMDLAVGDEFNLQTPTGDDLPSLSYAIRVVSAEPKTVAAGTFDALRIESTASLEMPLQSSTQTIHLPVVTSWVDESTGILLATATEGSLTFDRQDFTGLFELAEGWDGGSGTTYTWPQDIAASFAGRSAMELVEHEAGFTMAPALAVLAPAWSMAGSVLGMGMFGTGFGDGSEDGPYGGESDVPDVSFTRDEAGDSLLVVAADAGHAWGDLGLQAAGPVRYAVNAVAGASSCGAEFTDTVKEPTCETPHPAPLVAGDELRLCADSPVEAAGVEVAIVHLPTFTTILETTFGTLAACA